jgi:hypothetical protein
MRRANFVGTKFAGGESEGGVGIHFPLTPFSARPAQVVWFLPRRRRGISRDFVQKRFALRSVIAINQFESRSVFGIFYGKISCFWE